jgi:hypothetical protein
MLTIYPLSSSDFVIPDFATYAGIHDVEAIFDVTTVCVQSTIAMGYAMTTIITAVTELRINTRHRLVFNEHKYVHMLPEQGPFAVLILKGSLAMPTRHGERFFRPATFC